MRLQLLILTILIIPLALALQFIEPTEGATYNGTTNITYTWDQTGVDFALDSESFLFVNGTSITRELMIGTHNAIITSGNDTANRTVIILAPLVETTSTNQTNTTNQTNNTQNTNQTNTTQETNQTNTTNQTNQTNTTSTFAISITTDKILYEAGANTRIHVNTSSPAQLSFSISRNSVTIDTYTINIQQQTDFLYPVSATGQYSVAVSGQGASATATFTVQNMTLGVTIIGQAMPTINHVASYTAQTIGGTAPYTYFWQFNDTTTSTGVITNHVFTTNTSGTITVIVTDANGRQATATKAYTPTILLFKLATSVLSNTSKLLKNATVTLTDTRGGRTLVTDSFGEATFYNLTESNYSVNVTYNDTRTKPTTIYTTLTLIELTQDKHLTFRFAVPDQITTNTTTAVNTTSTAANTTLSAITRNTTNTSSLTQSIPQPVPTKTSLPEELARQEFEKTRSENIDTLKSIQVALSRSEEKQAVLNQLGLLTLYDAASQRMKQAATADEIEQALASVPKEVTVLAKDTTITKLTPDELPDAEKQFFAARSITDEKEQKKYIYNIEQASKNTTITTKRQVVRVTTYDGKQQLYTLFSRSIEAPEATSFIEIIPKNIATDASEIYVEGDHDVLQSDPVLRFMRNEYAYYVQGETDGEPIILPVPLELAEPPSLIGFVAVKLKMTSFDRGGLYLVLLGIILGIVVIGNVYLRRDSTSALPAFVELTELTLDTIKQGNYAIAAKHYEELKAIHATLPPDEQAETKDIVTSIKDANALCVFRATADHLNTLFSQHDIAAIAAAYEKTMHHYEALPETLQQQEKQRLDTINEALESHLIHHEN